MGKNKNKKNAKQIPSTKLELIDALLGIIGNENLKLQDFATLTNETLEILIASISPKPNENEDNQPELESKSFIFLHMAVDMEEDSVSITANNPNFAPVELHKKKRLSAAIIENLLPYLFSFNRFKNQLSFSFRIETGNNIKRLFED